MWTSWRLGRPVVSTEENLWIVEWVVVATIVFYLYSFEHCRWAWCLALIEYCHATLVILCYSHLPLLLLSRMSLGIVPSFDWVVSSALPSQIWQQPLRAYMFWLWGHICSLKHMCLGLGRKLPSLRTWFIIYVCIAYTQYLLYILCIDNIYIWILCI